MSSDVLRSLNEEVTKTKLEKDKENRKWSTFLQRPNRPVPKSKQQAEAERHAAHAYKVTIVKSAPRDKSPMVSVLLVQLPLTGLGEKVTEFIVFFSLCALFAVLIKKLIFSICVTAGS